MQEKENGKTPKYTEVVAALIVKDGRYLICRRPYGKARGGLWEFVGGKVEKGETKQQALKRECMEELAAQIDVGEEFCSVTHVYPDRRCISRCFMPRCCSNRTCWNTWI